MQDISRKNYLDIIRSFAIISVVLLHTLLRIPCHNIVIYLIHGVPLFLIISGGLMIEKAENLSISQFFSKYKKRILQFIVLIPLCAIVTNTLLWYCMGDIPIHQANSIPTAVGKMPVGALSFNEALTKAVIHGNGVFRCTLQMSQSHLWYLYIISGLYLFTPYLARITKGLSVKHLVILCVFLFVAQCSPLEFPKALFRPFNINYLLFYLLGYILVSRKRIEKKFHIIQLLCLLFAAFLLMLVLKNYPIQYISTLCFDVLKVIIPVIITGIAVQCDEKLRCPLVGSLSRCSFGIYLWHSAVLWAVSIWLPLFDFPQWFRLLAFFSISLCVPWGLTHILCHVRWLRWLVS